MTSLSKKFCQQFELKLPIIQAGMVWVSGSKLALASARNGVMGVLGTGSMNLDVLEHHLKNIQHSGCKNVAVNIPLLYEKNSEQIEMCLHYGIKIFITSAGTPKTYTPYLKSKGAWVFHLVSNPEFALKAEQLGVDYVIAEGFEAGGHNGRDEITTLSLIPQVLNQVKIPVIAAGGIATGKAMMAMLVLGASGVQMGTRFLMTQESSAHENYKKILLTANASSTKLLMKKYIPVRLFSNPFSQRIETLEAAGADKEELIKILGSGRARMGMFEGDITDGELEVGQIISMIKDLPSVSELVMKLEREWAEAKKEVSLMI